MNIKYSGQIAQMQLDSPQVSGYNNHTADYKPYEIGLQAHRQGLQLDDNPYWVSSDAWEEWRIGHMEAERLATDVMVLG